MRYQRASQTKHARAAALFSSLAAIAAAVTGCAEIPHAPAEADAAEVVVEVIGGDADIFPGAKFSVPVGVDTLLFIDANREPNTRIAGIWVDGGRQCCAEESVVRDTWVSLSGVRGGVVVTVELAKIDTVTPIAEMVSPALSKPDDVAANVSICSFGALEYRLNKAMASGYIKWRKTVNDDGWEDRDSLQVVRIPDDITKYGHYIGNWSYASPDGYLSEGLQKFDLTVSPVAGKRISVDQIAASKTYSFVIQFTDSLGNSTEAVSRIVWVSPAPYGCQ